jgi:hypothetical protein
MQENIVQCLPLFMAITFSSTGLNAGTTLGLDGILKLNIRSPSIRSSSILRASILRASILRASILRAGILRAGIAVPAQAFAITPEPNPLQADQYQLR